MSAPERRPPAVDEAQLDALDPLADPLRDVDDAVMLFDAEDGARRADLGSSDAVRPGRWRSSGVIAIVLIAAALTGAAIAFFATGRLSGTGVAATQPAGPPQAADVGTVTINSDPPGAEVSVDGVGRGTTPISVSLIGGEHTIELRNGLVTRMVPVNVQAGTSSSHYFELAQSAAASVGRLEVSSEPAGAVVTVDGTRRGTTPLVLDNVAVGDHRVVIAHGATSIARTVRVAPGTTASVVASVAPRGTAGGWVQIRAPFEMQVFENGELLGTTRADRLMLPTGRHELLIANSAYEFSTTAVVDVAADRTAAVRIDVPNGTMHLNAIPWAEVSIGGRAYGVTPLGNLSIAVGPHEVVFRHPQHGERRRTVQVTTRTPVRVGVDFTQ